MAAAYVALDYITSPFEADGPAARDVPLTAPVTDRGAVPVAQTSLAAFEAPEARTDGAEGLGFADPAPELAALTAPGAVVDETVQAVTPEMAPVRVVAGPPPVVPPQRPAATVDALAAEVEAQGPMPRPDRAMASAVQAALDTALTDPGADPASAASTFAAASGLTASLRPEIRPAGLVTVVASARAPQSAEVPSGVEVARAAAPETEIAPTPASIRPGPAIGARGNPCSGRLARAIPNRPRNAQGGSQVVAALQNAGGADRDAHILQAAYSGNVPDFLRDLHPVTFAGEGSGGRDLVVTICVTPDYFSVGSDRDFVRVPLGLPAALRLADRFDMMLPTPRMVDAIYAQADLRLSPQPMSPGAQMVTTGYFMQHDAMVDQQHARTGIGLGVLVAGHKKDLVLTNRLSSHPSQVAIYGWHRGNGNPIQPLSTVHQAQYADYSHGIRLVSRTAFVNGQAVDLGQLLTDARYASLLNSEGAITGRAVQMAALR